MIPFNSRLAAPGRLQQALTTFGLGVAALLSVVSACALPTSAQDVRPNILWLTCEDMGPHIGPYGDRYATTPHLDRFAKTALRYENVWSNAPVCAPARTTLISGLYPTATGSEHMRSMVRLPAQVKLYPQHLLEAGYYCTNNSKTDYNLEEPGKVWDESSPRAHWKNRPGGKPFFAVFNFTITHESQIRKRPHTLVHDPAKVPLPVYHPDTPEVRQDWAQYYDNITTMDSQVGEKLKELQEAGLADNTIVFFYSDHGSGMPRSKRWPYNSGLRVPMLIHFPAKHRGLAPKDYAGGGTTKRLVSFVDFAPTLLSLVGVQPPAHYQGHAFAGKHEAPAQPFLHGFRGRMDERCDLVRSVRDERYVYVRNYMPHRIYGQYLDYMFQTPTTRVWRRLYDDGKLNAAQKTFWEKKPAEELYDLQTDPDEVKNLAGSPEHREVIARLRKAQQDLALKIRDVGMLPEAEVHARAAGATTYEVARNAEKFPLTRILSVASAASEGKAEANDRLKNALNDPDAGVRYWAATGFLIREKPGVQLAAPELRRALTDASPSVRIVAAEALGRFGGPNDLQPALEALREAAPAEKHGVYVSIEALNAIDALGAKAAPLLPLVKSLSQPVAAAPARIREYTVRLTERITSELGK
ncbi:MAG: sulfatase-like hydrolase/transferase [Actinomycetota bacterium]